MQRFRTKCSSLAFGCMVFASGRPVLAGPACRCEWDGDCTVNSNDYFAFLGDYFAGQADFDRDGLTNSDDYFAFLACFFGPCGDDGRPATPEILGTVPPPPSNDNQPEVRGRADPGTTVRLYTDIACQGEPLAVGSAAAFLSPGVTVTVPDGSVTAIYAATEGAGGSISACSEEFVYAEGPATPPAQTLIFFDEFDKPGRIDESRWTTPLGDAAFFGRTALRNWLARFGQDVLEVRDGHAVLPLNTYNRFAPPGAPTFFGSEIDTVMPFEVGTGLAFEARVWIDPDLPSGAVTSLFAFNFRDFRRTHRARL